MKQRTTDDTMQDVKKRRKEGLINDFDILKRRKWGQVKDIAHGRAVTVDWNGDDDFRLRQLFRVKIGDEEAVISRQELEMLLRHV